MKKNFKFYVLGWVLILALFNIIAFVVPPILTQEKYTASFWTGWGVTVGAFLGQLICAWTVFKEKSAEKVLYNVSLYTVSYAGLIMTFVVSSICIIVTPIPCWAAAIACSVVLVISVVAILKAKIAVDAVADVDAKIEKATAFIYDMREESESLFLRVKADENKAGICKKVRDAFRFSDPMSSDALVSVESDIKIHFDLLKKAISEEKTDVAGSEAKETLALISERNNKCKRLK